MKLLSARVVDGQVPLPPGTAEEGALVTILVPDSDSSGFDLAPSEKALLLESIEQADRGEVIDGGDLLEQIRPR